MDDCIILKTSEIERAFKLNPDDIDKYLVFTCARGENNYIKEWVKHYLDIGFDKIIICDNNDDDTLSGILTHEIFENKVELFDLRGIKGSFQVQLYSAFAQKGNYKWCAYFDCDEFLELGCYSNIKDFLANIEENCVCFNWLTYGDNGQLHQKPERIQDRFPIPITPVMYFKENMFIKSILRGGENNEFKTCWFNGSHIPMTGDSPTKYNIGGTFVTDSDSHEEFPPRYKYGYLKHYYTKSFDEWIAKSSRGWPDGTPTLSASNYFLCNKQVDYPIENFIDGLFTEGFDWEMFSRGYNKLLDQYDVINITNKNKRVYPWLTHLMRFFKIRTGHTYIVTDEHIDDSLFNICLEYAIKTGNRLVYAKNYDEVWKTYLKYNDGRNYTYYILDLM